MAPQEQQTVPPVAPASAPRLLLLADPLSLEGLRSWLRDAETLGQIYGAPSELSGSPQLVLWSLSGHPAPATLAGEP